MSKTTPVIDQDKADLIAQYNWAITRLDEIINQPLDTNAKVVQAVKDEAKILRKVSVLMKKIIQHELR